MGIVLSLMFDTIALLSYCSEYTVTYRRLSICRLCSYQRDYLSENPQAGRLCHQHLPYLQKNTERGQFGIKIKPGRSPASNAIPDIYWRFTRDLLPLYCSLLSIGL